MQPNKIIFVTDGIYPHSVGGMQRHSRLLIEALASQFNIQITVIHPHKNEKLFPQFSNITEIVCDEPVDGIYLRNCYNYSRNVYNAIMQLPEQLIYSQGFSVWYKAEMFSNRLIVNPHGLEPWQGLTFKDNMIGIPFRFISKRIFKNASKVISLGGKLTGILKSLLPAEKIVVLSNAVNLPLRQQRSFNKEPLQLLFVGRFAFNKGIDVLLDAASQMNNDGFATHVVYNLVGKGPLFDELSAKYIAPNIIFHGFADDEKLKQLYNEADMFVFPTLFEGMPTVVLEAMSYCLPVIVTDTGATAELVDNTNGYLIDKQSAIALKNAIKTFFALPESEKQKMADCSYNKVMERFTWPQVAGRHFELFQQFWNKK